MSTLPTNRTTANTAIDHLNDHNEIARLHNVWDGYSPYSVGQTVFAKDFGLATAASGTTNTAALQAAIDYAAANGITRVYVATGTYNFDLVAHPNTNASFTKTVVALRAGVKLCGAGARLTTLKLIAGASLQSGTQNRFIINWDPLAVGAVDVGLDVEDLTLDGNSLNVGNGTTCTHGIQFWNVRRAYVRRCHVKNMRGNDTSSFETFHIDFVRSQDVGIDDCRVFCDDTGNTASGVSMNFTDRFWIRGTSSRNMKNGQGFTYYCSANGFTSDCFAGGNGAAGFNEEHCSDLEYVNCNSGSESARTDSSTLSAAYTEATLNANDTGFIFLHTHGGGRIHLNNCHSRGNTTRNVGVTGSVTATSTGGTTASTIVLTTSVLFQPMVGNYVNVNGGAWVKIISVSGTGASTTCTTDIAHGGTTGQTVLIQMGQITWSSGSITGGVGKGLQFTDSTTALKQLSARRCNFTGVVIHSNATNDLEDVGNGSSTSVARASGMAPAANTDNLATTVELYNPFPMDMLVIISGTLSAGTQIRGTHPKDTANSMGLQTGSFLVKAGGAITITGSAITTHWMFV